MSGRGICLTCRYFEHDVDAFDEADKGLCRRNPPAACYDAEEDSVATVWPAVDWSDWCGEWGPE